jgi:ACS family hexuronate transporter-like MFS transporter
MPSPLRALVAWVPVASMMLVSLVSYIDRSTLALLAPTILAELHLSGEQYGWMISCFSVAYSLGNPVWGGVLDRIGLRRGMLAAVALWTVASASHAGVSTFVGFALARALLGFGEGATFPGGLRAATQTLPPERRARGVAIAYSGGSLGAILTPLLVTPVAVAHGWRAAFLCTGVLGAAWLVLWALVGRGERPRPEELPEAPAQRSVRLGEPRLWAFIAVYALGALPLGFVLYGAPLYLYGALGKDQAALGRLLWLPPVGWEIGYFFWGYWTDRALRRGREAFAAFPVLIVGLTLLSLPLAAAPLLPSVAVALAAFVLATFVAAGFIIVGLAYAARVFSTREAGLIAGIGAGSWSAVVALLMPWFGRLFDRHAYALAFGLAAGAPVLGALVWSVIDRRAVGRSRFSPASSSR